jgi:hypothetical protein
MRKFYPVWMVVMLLLSSLACNIGAQTAERPGPEIPVSTEAVESLVEKVEAAATQAVSGQEVELVLNESEITSLVVFELQAQGQQAFRDVQVYLRDGKVQFYGYYEDGDVSLPLEVVAEPSVTEGGGLQIELVSAKLGPIPAPEVLRNQFQSILDDQITPALLRQAGSTFILSSLSTADGNLTMRGRIP